MTPIGKPKSASERENLQKVSIPRIKKEMHDVFYLSDDLVITSLDAQHNATTEHPVSIDGFSVIIMMAGEAVVSIDMKNYAVRPNSIVFFNPGSIIRTVKCSSNAAAFVLAFSKSFVNEIQIDLSTCVSAKLPYCKSRNRMWQKYASFSNWSRPCCAATRNAIATKSSARCLPPHST